MVANTDDVGQLAGAMRDIAAPDRYADMKAVAGLRRHDYSLENMVAETERVYRSLL